MNKSTAWIVLLGIIVAAISGFALGRVHGRNTVDTPDEILAVATGDDMAVCQNAQVGFDDTRGVIVPVSADCAVVSLVQLGDDVYADAYTAEQARDALVAEYGTLPDGSAPFAWYDITPMETVYSLRIGFYTEDVANGFCARATAANFPCRVVPVTTVEM